MSATRFRSRIDAVIALILVTPICGVGYLLVAGGRDGVGTPTLLVVTLAAVIALIGWIVLDTSYEVTESHLVVRSGPQRFRIPLTTIRRVRRCHTLIAASALSLCRLEIDYGRGGLAVISPDREREFLALLRKQAPSIDLTSLVNA